MSGGLLEHRCQEWEEVGSLGDSAQEQIPAVRSMGKFVPKRGRVRNGRSVMNTLGLAKKASSASPRAAECPRARHLHAVHGSRNQRRSTGSQNKQNFS
eukprot:4755640-Pyramimonas_sp.AAC.1